MPTTFIRSMTDLAQLPHDGLPQIVFVGRSNVGKSSLLNGLSGVKNLANVSAQPGRTQTLNLFSVDKRYYLVDLPGYGYARASKAKREAFTDLIQQYLEGTEQITLVILVIDARVGPTDLDQEMIELLHMAGLPYAIIANKMDKLSMSEASKLLRMLESSNLGAHVIPHSSVTGKGREEIRQTMERALKNSSL